MMSSKKTKTSLVKRLMISLAIVSMPLVVVYLKYPSIHWHETFKSIFRANPKKKLHAYKIPLIKEQPKDKIVAKDIIQIYEWQTKEGVPVYFSPTESLPMMDVNVAFKTGASLAANQPGLIAILVKMLKEDTLNASSEVLNASIEKIGMELSIHSSLDQINLHFKILSEDEYWLPAIQIINDILSKSALLPERFEQLKNQHLVQIKRKESIPATQIQKAFFAEAYVNHPYGINYESTYDDFKTLELPAVRTYYQDNLVAENALITVSGGIHRDIVEKIAQNISSHLRRGKKLHELAQASSKEDKLLKKINFPSQQTHISIGQPTISPAHPDYLALKLGNEIFGRAAFVSRLFKVIRGEYGYAYNVHSSLIDMKANGPFNLVLQTKNEDATKAYDKVIELLEEFIAKGPSDEELFLAKESMVNAFPLQLNSIQKINAALLNMAIFDLPKNYLDVYQHKLMKITKEQVIEAFQKYLNVAKMTKLTLGPQVLD